jgi:hypothetical protein
MDPWEKVELERGYDARSRYKTNIKKISIKCKVNWEAYKEMVAAS